MVTIVWEAVNFCVRPRQFGKARVNVKLGHYNLMHVLFIIGE
jgi:hypothetical protein